MEPVSTHTPSGEEDDARAQTYGNSRARFTVVKVLTATYQEVNDQRERATLFVVIVSTSLSDKQEFVQHRRVLLVMRIRCGMCVGGREPVLLWDWYAVSTIEQHAQLVIHRPFQTIETSTCKGKQWA